MTKPTLDEELHTLCVSCGICCSGLFAAVEVRPDEMRPETRRRLAVIESEAYFRLPCTAHSSETGCTVYDDRPERCRSYVCALYQAHEKSGGPLEARLAKVRAIQALIDRVKKRAPTEKAVWLLRSVYLAVGKASLTETDRELLLDITELAMRLTRDSAFSPVEPKTDPSTP